MHFSLEQFLANHKPKSDNMHVYAERKKLENYQSLDDKSNLVPKKIWIKYVPYKLAFKTYDLDSHIKPGGLLIGCGEMSKGIFKRCEADKCTHLLLRYENREEDEKRTFVIKLANCYVYWRAINKSVDIQVVLIDDDEIERIVESFLRKISKDKGRDRR